MSNREQLRYEAHCRIRFTEGWSWPTDLLLAFAPDHVDVEYTSAILSQAFADAEPGKPRQPVDEAAQRATLMLLRCWCKDCEELSKSLPLDSLGPSEADINSANISGTNPFPNRFWYSPGTNQLFSEVQKCCQRFGWSLPTLPEVTEIRTPQQAVIFIRAVEEWVQRKEEDLDGASSPPVPEKRGKRANGTSKKSRKLADKPLLVRCGLRKYHKCEGQEYDREIPLTSGRKLREFCNKAFSARSVDRFLKDCFGGRKGYVLAWSDGTLATRLAVDLDDKTAFGTFDHSENEVNDDQDDDESEQDSVKARRGAKRSAIVRRY